MNQKIHLTYTNTYSPNLYHCRNLLLGGDNLAGIFQTPWQGKLQYDYIFFIDTDQVFDPDQVYSLIDRMESSPHIEVLSGMYVMALGDKTPVVLSWDTEYFSQNGKFNFQTPRQMVEHGKKSDNGLVKAFYTGMGFTIFRKGVFDRLEYPWFRPLTHKVGENMDLMGEDVALFYNLYEKGIDLWIDPQVYVGHEKYQVLKPMGEF
jgi:cellulose synthase/poly-beta-1,6-N-acetylglucosamine synthase-like glycosyltransferase